MGIGWYRKSFVPDLSFKGKRVLLDFEGIMLYGDVWVNGEKLVGSDYGYLGFETDIINYIRFDKTNVIAVKTDTGEPDNCRWYNVPKKRNKISWEGIKSQKDNITAIARDGHKEVVRHKLETTGKAIALQLQADTEDWKADENDLQHIRIYAVDSKGRRVYDAENTIHFSVTGDATLIAVDNGNIYSDEQYTGDSRKLFKGSALAILRSGNKAGKIRFKAYTEGLKSATLNLITNIAVR